MPKERSKTVHFPRYSLKQCEKWLKKIPPAREVTRDNLLETIGYTNPTSSEAGSAMGALSMFRLIKKSQNLYELSSFGRALRNPVSDQQGRVLRILACLLPEKFREFYSNLKGKEMDIDGYIEKLFSNKFTVTDKVSNRFEKAFIESGLHAQIIMRKQDERIKVENIDSILEHLGIDSKSFNEISNDILENLTDKELCKRLIDSITSNSTAEKKQTIAPTSHISSQTDSTKSRIKEQISILDNDSELVQFETDAGVYAVEKDELLDFINQRGKKLSEKKAKL